MIIVGSKEGEHVLIKSLEKVSAGVWCRPEVHIQVNHFTGKITPYIEHRDIYNFYEQSVQLYSELTGRAEFTPIDCQFSLVLVGDGKGHIQVKGSAYAHATYGSCLEYEFSIDQTHLPRLIRSLEKALE